MYLVFFDLAHFLEERFGAFELYLILILSLGLLHYVCALAREVECNHAGSIAGYSNLLSSKLRIIKQKSDFVWKHCLEILSKIYVPASDSHLEQLDLIVVSRYETQYPYKLADDNSSP